VILPLLIFSDSELLGRRVPTAGCAASTVGLAGYVFGILAHYRLLFPKNKQSPDGIVYETSRTNPEPLKRVIVYICIALAALIAVVAFAATT
jgi:membrane associated rhomboid family serine protease